MFKSLPKALLLLALVVPTAGFLSASQTDLTDAASAILGAGKTAAKVAKLRQVPSVGAIDVNWHHASPVSDLGNELINLGIYADRNAAGVSQLRHALAANPVTRHALAANHISVGRVVGVQIGATGSLRLYLE
jgi:hypothetical protein